jgi:hypothetical protein
MVIRQLRDCDLSLLSGQGCIVPIMSEHRATSGSSNVYGFRDLAAARQIAPAASARDQIIMLIENDTIKGPEKSPGAFSPSIRRQ